MATKEETIQVRVYPADRTEINVVAAKLNVSQAEAIHIILREYLSKR